MKISVKLTRAENTALLGAGPVELDLEEYLCGVVPSEIYESSHMEALKAQAVAARTFAVKRAMAGTVVDDTTSFQAYRAPLAESSPRSRQAVEDFRHTAPLWQSPAPAAGRPWRKPPGRCLPMAAKSLTAFIRPQTAAPANAAEKFGVGTIPTM